MQSEDIAANVAIGRYGADSMELKCTPDTPLRILTHCNTGSLATAGFGTALGRHSFYVLAEAQEVFCSWVSIINPPVSSSDSRTFLAMQFGRVSSFQSISSNTKGYLLRTMLAM